MKSFLTGRSERQSEQKEAAETAAVARRCRATEEPKKPFPAAALQEELRLAEPFPAGLDSDPRPRSAEPALSLWAFLMGRL